MPSLNSRTVKLGGGGGRGHMHTPNVFKVVKS